MRISWMLGLVFCFGTVFGQGDEQAIRACFDGYKKSILKDKGEKAVTYLDSRTVDYYGDILEFVRYADSATIDPLPLVDKINVLTIRHQATREQIGAFTPASLLVYSIDQGMIDKSSVSENALGKITIGNDEATGQLVADGLPTPLSFSFRKEGGAWKLDLTTLFEISNEAIAMMVEESGETENDFIFSLLEFVTDRKPDGSLWKQVVSNPK